MHKIFWMKFQLNYVEKRDLVYQWPPYGSQLPVALKVLWVQILHWSDTHGQKLDSLATWIRCNKEMWARCAYGQYHPGCFRIWLYAQSTAAFVACRELLFSLPYKTLSDILPLTNPLVQYIQLSDIQRFCHIPSGGTKVCAHSGALIFNTSGFTHFMVYLQENIERILTEYCFQNDWIFASHSNTSPWDFKSNR